jgi:hypothetical protein
VDRRLAWLILSLGAVFGTLFSVFSSRIVHGMTTLSFANRFIQLSFSLFLSLSLLLSIARGIHYDRGLILSLVPTFCVVTQSLPQHQMSALILFLVSCVVLSRCLSASITDLPSEQNMLVSDQQQAAILHLSNTGRVEEESASVWEVVQRALQLFVLAFYASVQHAPTQEYFHVKEHHHPHQHDTYPHHHPTPPALRRAVYASSHHSMNTRYALMVGLVGALVRVTFWYILCFFQDNTMHIMLENDHSRGPWDWSCCIVYMTALLYSGCWTATQIREQVLPHLKLHLKVSGHLKLTGLLLALAALYRQRDNGFGIFMATNALSLALLATTAFTLK